MEILKSHKLFLFQIINYILIINEYILDHMFKCEQSPLNSAQPCCFKEKKLQKFILDLCERKIN